MKLNQKKQNNILKNKEINSMCVCEGGKVSVIIPCYNVAGYLDKCLQSVFNQKFKNYEIICIEDCSSDNTKNILHKYEKQHKIKVIYHNQNKGLAISRNDGIKRAQGDYIFFLDSDDFISPECLEILCHQGQKNQFDLVMAEIQAYPEDPKNEFCVNHSKHLNNWLYFNDFSKQKIKQGNVLDWCHKLHCCAVNKLYKKSFLLKNNICFINRKCYHEDNGFWFKVLACDPVISGINNITYFYRVRNGSISDKMKMHKKEHTENLILSLMDALTFTKQKNNDVLSDFITCKIHHLEKHWPISFLWTMCEKHIKVFYFPVFRLKLSPKKRKYVLKILGIPVFKWRKK